MQIEENLPRLDELLAPYRARSGADYDAYRNHCRRMLNFCLALRPASAEEREKMMIAACFHDLGVWTDDTLDYLPPSVRLAHEYLAAHGPAAWSDEIAQMIDGTTSCGLSRVPGRWSRCSASAISSTSRSDSSGSACRRILCVQSRRASRTLAFAPAFCS